MRRDRLYVPVGPVAYIVLTRCSSSLVSSWRVLVVTRPSFVSSSVSRSGARVAIRASRLRAGSLAAPPHGAVARRRGRRRRTARGSRPRPHDMTGLVLLGGADIDEHDVPVA